MMAISARTVRFNFRVMIRETGETIADGLFNLKIVPRPSNVNVSLFNISQDLYRIYNPKVYEVLVYTDGGDVLGNIKNF